MKTGYPLTHRLPLLQCALSSRTVARVVLHYRPNYKARIISLANISIIQLSETIAAQNGVRTLNTRDVDGSRLGIGICAIATEWSVMKTYANSAH
jgi:hypothetical protein